MRTRSLLFTLAALGAAALAACQGSGPSKAPGAFPAVNPSGDHAESVVVGDVGSGCSGGTTNSAVLFYSLGTNTIPLSGNLAPSTDLTGAHTQLNYPAGLFVDDNGNLWVSSYGAAAVQQYSVAPKPTAAPSKTITDTLDTPHLSGPTALYVQQNASGVNTWVYVADFLSNAIDVFAASASGNVHASYQIAGATTALSSPSGIVLDRNGNIWVGNRGGSDILEFPPVTALATGANDIAPSVKIGAGTTGLVGPTGVYFDRTGDLWVGDQFSDAISEFSASSIASSYTGSPAVTIKGAATGIAAPFSVVIDSGANVYETGFSGATVNIWSATNALTGGNIAPTYTILGAATKLVCPSAIQVYSTSGTTDV
ncbi:MAG: hypothetical protein ACREMP_03100 [Candidatus Tyrphobacter sp.]